MWPTEAAEGHDEADRQQDVEQDHVHGGVASGAQHQRYKRYMMCPRSLSSTVSDLKLKVCPNFANRSQENI